MEHPVVLPEVSAAVRAGPGASAEAAAVHPTSTCLLGKAVLAVQAVDLQALTALPELAATGLEATEVDDRPAHTVPQVEAVVMADTAVVNQGPAAVPEEDRPAATECQEQAATAGTAGANLQGPTVLRARAETEDTAEAEPAVLVGNFLALTALLAVGPEVTAVDVQAPAETAVDLLVRMVYPVKAEVDRMVSVVPVADLLVLMEYPVKEEVDRMVSVVPVADRLVLMEYPVKAVVDRMVSVDPVYNLLVLMALRAAAVEDSGAAQVEDRPVRTALRAEALEVSEQAEAKVGSVVQERQTNTYLQDKVELAVSAAVLPPARTAPPVRVVLADSLPALMEHLVEAQVDDPLAHTEFRDREVVARALVETVEEDHQVLTELPVKVAADLEATAVEDLQALTAHQDREVVVLDLAETVAENRHLHTEFLDRAVAASAETAAADLPAHTGHQDKAVAADLEAEDHQDPTERPVPAVHQAQEAALLADHTCHLVKEGAKEDSVDRPRVRTERLAPAAREVSAAEPHQAHTALQAQQVGSEAAPLQGPTGHQEAVKEGSEAANLLAHTAHPAPDLKEDLEEELLQVLTELLVEEAVLEVRRPAHTALQEAAKGALLQGRTGPRGPAA